MRLALDQTISSSSTGKVVFGADLTLALCGAVYVLGYFLASVDAWSLDFAWLADGKTVVTGLAFGYLAVELTKLSLGVRVKTGDGLAFPLALALAVGRWGCFCNGCCYGVVTTLPWGVVFHDGVPRHPTQLYESLFHGTTAVVLLLLARVTMLAENRVEAQRRSWD